MEVIFYFIVALLIGIWMYTDAKKRKLEQPSTWLIIGILFSVFGLLTYLYWQNKSTK